jgi:hypothetical protein
MGRCVAVIMLMMLMMIVDFITFPVRLGRTMLVKMKRADQQKHPQESDQDPDQRYIQRSEFDKAVGQHVQHSDPQHQSSHQAQHNLHAYVSQMHTGGQPTAEQ